LGGGEEGGEEEEEEEGEGGEHDLDLGWDGFLMEMLMVSTLLGVNRSIVGDDGSLVFFFAYLEMDGVGVGYVCNVYTWSRYIGFLGSTGEIVSLDTG